MASIIRVKRSTGTIAPATLNYGELGLTIGVGTHGNGGGKLFVGDNSSNPLVVGGKYYTDLLSIAPGLVDGQTNPTTPANGFVAILDSNRKVNQWNVDNLRLDDNTLSSQNTDGDINLDPNGTGEIVIPDDTYLTFGTSKDAKIEYDENGTDKVQVTGADWNFANDVAIRIDDITPSTTPTTGALTVTGGVGFATHLNVGGSVDIDLDLNVDGGDITTNLTAFNLLNSTATTVNFAGAATTINLGANSGTLTVGNPTVVGTQATQNLYNTVATTVNAFGDASTIGIGSTSATLTLRPNTVVGVNATQNLYNTVATTVNAFGDASTIGIGSTSATLTLRPSTVVGTQTTQNLYNTTATTVNAFGDASTIGIGSTSATLTLRPSTVVGTATTQNLYNTVATTVNAFGAATAIGIGSITGTVTINNPTVVGTQTTQDLYNTVATTVNFAGAATTIGIGSITGTATIRNETLSVPNATTLTLGATSSATSVTFPSTPNNSFVSIAATTNATTTTSGALRVAGGVGIVSDVYIGGILNVTGNQSGSNLTLTGNLQVDGNTTLGNAPGDVVTITGSVNHTGPLTNTGGVTIDNIGISSNVISTRSGGGNILYIDPYPDGLSNEGMVVIKGDLQVDGTTTTVNSSSVTVNDAILSLGEVTSARTVVATVASGVSTISLDSVVGINTGDIITGNAALPNSGLTTITAYNTATKIITITGTTSSGISTTSQLTVIHAYDTNTDRGISFDYNTGAGTTNNKTGFFGYHDTTNSGSAAPARSWTYVPDATNSNNVITGTRGYLDIKGIYYQTGDFNTHGVVFFDNDGLQTSTNNPSTASNTRTSTQILTAITEINLSLPSSTSVTAGDQVTQVNNSGAYGVVKTTVSGTTITLIGVQGTFDTTNDLKVNGANISIIPGTVTTIYTNKPMWTDTLDGGTF